LFGKIELKHSINSPFLKEDLPELKSAQTFDLTKDFILKDSCPIKISTSKVPLLVELSFAFKNLVKDFFFL